ncbi:MAG: amidohydrolase family protein [Acidimicrobiales bacterium]
MRYYSCDSHVVEAPEVFLGLDERFGERAPRIVNGLDGKRGEFVLLPGSPPIPVGRLGIAGNRLDDPRTQERISQGYAGLNPGVMDPHRRLDEQKLDGIVGEVMYPSINLFTFALPERDLVDALFKRHNDWVLDYCSAAPERLVGVGCLPLPDVEAALAEMQRAAARGVRGFAIPAHVPVDRPFRHPDYDRFWAVAEDLGVPLTMHVFTGATFDAGLAPHWGLPAWSIKGYTFVHTGAANSVIDLICGGVCERFPRLKFVLSEFETGWVAHFLQRLDHATYRTPSEAVDYLTMKPSDYFRRNFHITFEDDEAGIRTRDLIGLETLLWGNDYPHHDAIWPHSMQTLDRVLAGVPDDEREQMVFTNTIELYSIDAAALPG